MNTVPGTPDAAVSDAVAPDAVVLVPIKGFDRAKRRLSSILGPAERAGLARWMAEQVLRAAAPLGVTVVCDDESVASWAAEHSADVAWTPGLDLNQSLSAAVAEAARAGVTRAVIAHADLPFAHNLPRFASPDLGELRISPDRHGTGTNVMSVPTAAGMELSYGTNSFQSHCAAARRLGLTVTVVDDPQLGWDVDEPDDLTPPAELGTIPAFAPNAPAGKSA